MRRGIITSIDIDNSTAGVQLDGSPTSITIAIADHVEPYVGQSCAVAFFGDGANPDDAVIVAVWED